MEEGKPKISAPVNNKKNKIKYIDISIDIDIKKICSLIYFSFFFKFFWTQEMTSEERAKLTDLKKCDFGEMSNYFKAQSEARKAMSKEEKQVSCCLRVVGHTAY